MRLIFLSPGTVACCNGAEAKDAAAVARYGMVDETETVAVEIETESAAVRAAAMGGDQRGGGAGDNQRFSGRPTPRHQTTSLLRSH